MIVLNGYFKFASFQLSLNAKLLTTLENSSNKIRNENNLNAILDTSSYFSSVVVLTVSCFSVEVLCFLSLMYVFIVLVEFG